MAGMPDTARWQRLGEILQRRRVEIDPRYSNHSVFVSERGINLRLSWDLEHAARDNYRAATLRAAEIAYQMPLGSVNKILDGDEQLPAIPRRTEDPLNALQPAATEWEREQARQYIENLRRAVQARMAAERDGQQRPA